MDAERVASARNCTRRLGGGLADQVRYRMTRLEQAELPHHARGDRQQHDDDGGRPTES